MELSAIFILGQTHEKSNFSFQLKCRVTVVTFVILATAGTVYISCVKVKRRKANQVNFLPTKCETDEKIIKRLKTSVAEKFWECFSLKENFGFIISTKINKKSIAPIHGIRALGALWIIVAHVYYYAFGPTDNIQLIFAYADSWVLQPLFSAAISVDSFYVMR